MNRCERRRMRKDGGVRLCCVFRTTTDAGERVMGRRAETTHAVYTHTVCTHTHARDTHVTPRRPRVFFHPDAADVLIVIYRDIGEKSVGPRGPGDSR